MFEAGAAGIALVPMAAVFFVVSNLSGRLAETVGTRAMIGGGTALTGIGLFVIACTVAGKPVWLGEMGLVLTGLGMGLNTGPLFGVAVASVPAARSGSAASLINVARMIGATLGVAVLGSAFAVAGAGARVADRNVAWRRGADCRRMCGVVRAAALRQCYCFGLGR